MDSSKIEETHASSTLYTPTPLEAESALSQDFVSHLLSVTNISNWASVGVLSDLKTSSLCLHGVGVYLNVQVDATGGHVSTRQFLFMRAWSTGIICSLKMKTHTDRYYARPRFNQRLVSTRKSTRAERRALSGGFSETYPENNKAAPELVYRLTAGREVDNKPWTGLPSNSQATETFQGNLSTKRDWALSSMSVRMDSSHGGFSLQSQAHLPVSQPGWTFSNPALNKRPKFAMRVALTHCDTLPNGSCICSSHISAWMRLPPRTRFYEHAVLSEVARHVSASSRRRGKVSCEHERVTCQL